MSAVGGQLILYYGFAVEGIVANLLLYPCRRCRSPVWERWVRGLTGQI